MTVRGRVRQLSADRSVKTLITWPYTTCGRSRRGSPKAGTNEHILYIRVCMRAGVRGCT